MSEKIKYWWSEDRQWFCIVVNDGTAKATVSLTVKEAEALMDEVMQTPSFLELQRQARERALELLEKHRLREASSDETEDYDTMLTTGVIPESLKHRFR